MLSVFALPTQSQELLLWGSIPRPLQIVYELNLT